MSNAILKVEGNPKSAVTSKVTAPKEIWTHLIALQRKYSPHKEITRKKEFYTYENKNFIPQFAFPLELKGNVLHFKLDLSQWEKTSENALMWENKLHRGWTMQLICKKGFVINKLIHGFRYSAIEIEWPEKVGLCSRY